MVIALSGATASQVADAVQAGRSPTKLGFFNVFLMVKPVGFTYLW
jgi:hypothetical protein